MASMSHSDRVTCAALLAALAAADRPAGVVESIATSVPAPIRRRLARLRRHWSLLWRDEPVSDTVRRATRLLAEPTFDTIDNFRPPSSRRTLVLSGGASLNGARADIERHRDELWLVAPFRPALRLTQMGIVPDVVLLADRDASPADVSESMWAETPSAIRKRLGAEATLVCDAFAPRAVSSAFRTVYLFDSGLGGVPTTARVPFHGYGLLACVCLAFATGYRQVAIMGADLASARGRRFQAWDGGVLRVDPSSVRLLRLLELIAEAGDMACIDCSPASVRKTGWTLLPLDAYVSRRASEPVAQSSATQMRGSPETATIARALVRHDLEILDRLIERTEVGLAELGATLRDPSTNVSLQTPLGDILEEMEGSWADDPVVRQILAWVNPVYLLAFWTIRRQGVTPANTPCARLRRARLVLPELAELLDGCRDTISGHLADAGLLDTRDRGVA